METIEIALASDSAYFPGLLVSAVSIARSASHDARLRFNVLDGGIDDKDLLLLHDTLIASHPGTTMRTFKIDDSIFSSLRTWNGNGRIAYARLLLPDLLPNTEFAVYCDADFLWTADIADLWRLRNRSTPLQACLDTTSSTLRKENDWFEKQGISFTAEKYVCSGLMVMNLDMFRRRGLRDKLFDFLETHPDCPYIDQTAINATIDNIGILPSKWCEFAHLHKPGHLHGGSAIHFAGSAPWRSGWWTNALTDAHKIWYELYGEIFGIGWRAARRKFLPLRQTVPRCLIWTIVKHAALRVPFFLFLRLMRRGCYIPELKELSS